MSRKNVSAATVRAWARENVSLIPEGARAGLGENARGRLHPEIRAAYSKAHKGQTYEPKVAEAPTFTVPVTTLDKNGRKTTVKRVVTNAEARAALGQVTTDGDKTLMQRGRMNHGLLALALSAAEADRLADSFA